MVERALRMAEIRVLPIRELLDRIPQILDDDDREQILFHLNEVDLPGEDAETFAKTVELLSDEWERLPSREKARADAILSRLIRCLPELHRFRLGLTFLSHSRKRRRQGAYKVFKESGTPPKLQWMSSHLPRRHPTNSY